MKDFFKFITRLDNVVLLVCLFLVGVACYAENGPTPQIIVGSSGITDASVTTAKIADDAVTAEKILETEDVELNSVTLAEKVRAAWADILGNVYASGSAIVGAGTAAAPAYSTTGDDNTGIYFPAADTVGISAGGAEAARITSSGNVLIGTTTDDGSSKLQINGNIIGDNLKIGTISTTNATITYHELPLSQFTTVDGGAWSFDLNGPKTFLVYLSNGDSAMINCNYLGTAVTITGSNGSIVNSSTPGASELGIFKSSGVHTISLKAGASASSEFAIFRIYCLGVKPENVTYTAP